MEDFPTGTIAEGLTVEDNVILGDSDVTYKYVSHFRDCKLTLRLGLLPLLVYWILYAYHTTYLGLLYLLNAIAWSLYLMATSRAQYITLLLYVSFILNLPFML